MTGLLYVINQCGQALAQAEQTIAEQAQRIAVLESQLADRSTQDDEPE